VGENASQIYFKTEQLLQNVSEESKPQVNWDIDYCITAQKSATESKVFTAKTSREDSNPQPEL